MADFRLWVKFSLFLSSYIPLWLAMALKTGDVTVVYKEFLCQSSLLSSSS